MTERVWNPEDGYPLPEVTAADRLRDLFDPLRTRHDMALFDQELDAALAAERRATVEPRRIAMALRHASTDFDLYDERQTDKAAAWISEYLLDEEAAR